jgi:uncharacterized membrane protein
MMYLLTITDLIAHLHPALVHLPIGILLIALILQLLAVKDKFHSLRAAIPIILLAGVVSAVLSCITGFMLFRSSDYDKALVSWHMYMALALTFMSFALCARSFSGRAFDRTGKWLGAGVLVLLMITGHLGGSLTHGEDYLFRGPHKKGSGAAAGEALIPEEAVEPGDKKAIAKLREGGVVVVPVTQNSNYLMANFSGVRGAALVPLLLFLRKQLVQLDLSGSGVEDSSMEVVKQCAALREVNLSNTGVTDRGVVKLGALQELRVLNLVDTQVTGEGLLSMQPSKHLHALYLYHTRVEGKYWEKLKGLYRGAVLDSGGYELPKPVTDTAVVRVN